MKYGVVFPQNEFPSDPIAIRDFAQAAENLGYHHLLAYDHILGANPDRKGGWSGPFTCHDTFQEPLTLFSFLAGVTATLNFISGIIILPQRETALFAKQAATLDILSGGRLRIGIGIGWNEIEYISQNKDFHDRGRRIEEQVKVLRLLWTSPLVTFTGRWHTILDAGLNPLPVQQPIPIWFGGHADPVLHRIARMGDGWLPNYLTPEECSPSLEKLHRYLAEQRRTPDEIGIEPRIKFQGSSPDEWHRLVESWRAVGATHLTFNTMGAGFKSPQGHIQAMEQFAQTLGL